MAETSVSVAQNQFKCPFCLDLLKDPVTIPCGHSYCMGCIKSCWDQDDQTGLYSCCYCRQTFTPRPVVGKNPILADLVEKLRASDVECHPSDFEEAGPDEVECTVCVRRKRKAEKSCLECLASYCAPHFNLHEELHTGKRHKVVEAVSDLQSNICPEHKRPLEVFCRTHQLCVCLLCLVDEHKGHDIVSAEEAQMEKKAALEKIFSEQVLQRETELEKLRQAIEPFKSSAQVAVEESEKTLNVLQGLIEQTFSELRDLIRSQERFQINQADDLEKRLEEKIALVKERSTELERLSQTKDPIDFLQRIPSLCPPEDLDIVTIDSHLFFGTLKPMLFKLKEEVEGSCKKELSQMTYSVNCTSVENISRATLMTYFCQPTLDHLTAFRHHCLSENDTKLSWSHTVIHRGKGQSRFHEKRQVLCNEGLSACHYWEIAYTKNIDIAVAYKTICRKGYDNKCAFGLNDKSWKLACTSNHVFHHNNIVREINCPVYPKIGVFLNHKAGMLSFFGVSGQEVTLLLKVQTIFTEPLYPGFYLSCNSELKICPRNGKYVFFVPE